MRSWIALVAAPLFILAVTPAHAEDGKLTIDFGARARIETIDGQFRPGIARHDTALLLRTGLSAEYDAGPLIIGGEVLDSRAYFEREASSVSSSEVDTIEPVQAYLKSDFSDRLSVQAGRFTMDLGSQRLVARSNFRNTVNGFTGARADLTADDRTGATLFWALPQQRLPDDHDSVQANDVQIDRERFGLQFFGAIVTRKDVLGGTFEAYLYRLAERDADGIATRDRHLWTPGARLFLKPAKNAFDYEIEAAWQGGHARASTAATDTIERHVSAGFAHAAVGRTLPGAWQPRLQLAADYASGDKPGGDYTRFDTLFGSHTNEFGPSSLYNPVAEANLVSAEARAEVTPSKRLDGYLAVRPLWLARNTDSFGGTGVRDTAGNSGHYAGTQLEIRARYWLAPKKLRLTAAAATLFKGRFLHDAPNAPATGDTHYGYLELQLTL